MLRFRGVSKAYRNSERPALIDVSFDVGPGEIVGLVGLNGAGKTTLIRSAIGLLIPTSGTVEVDGHDIVHDKAAASRGIGWVPEIPVFPPRDSLLSILEYLAGYYGGTAGTLEEWAGLLRWVGLQEQATHRFSTLSQGMKKRFAIAAAMLGNPPNLLLDEVLNGLDPEWIRFTRELILEWRRQGRSVLLSSHLLGELEGVADRFAFIHQGRLYGVWPKESISASLPPRYLLRIANPDDRVAALLGAMGDLQLSAPWYILERPRAPPEAVTAEMTRAGYVLQEFRVEEAHLEEFFFGLLRSAGMST